MIQIELPEWLDAQLRRLPAASAPADRMAQVIEVSQRNVEHATGGPFAAGVYDLEDQAWIALGVNVVMSSGYCIAHAEVIALCLAEASIGDFDLARRGPRYQLVTSAEPCVMCLGAVIWSGVRSLVCGARSSDVEAIGFDEGPKPDDWVAALESRGISVQRDVERSQAVAVLEGYRASGGPIYNAARAE